MVERIVKFKFLSLGINISFPNLLKTILSSGFSIVYRKCIYTLDDETYKEAFNVRLGFWGILVVLLLSKYLAFPIGLKILHYIVIFVVLDILQVVINRIHQFILDTKIVSE